MSLIISGFCVGLRIISSPGMILHFLRKPYSWLADKIDSGKEMVESLGEDINQKRKDLNETILSGTEHEIDKTKNELVHLSWMLEKAKKELKKRVIYHYLLKPVIGCGTCMASIWTFVWFPLFEVYSLRLILVMFCVATLNSLIHALYEKLA